jgi:plastocyanin
MPRAIRFSLSALLLLLGCSVFAAEPIIINLTSDLHFDPPVKMINKGDTVTFKNASGIPHNVIANDGSFCCNGGACKPGSACSTVGNFTSTMTFDTAGTVDFYCSLHGAPGVGMHGQIIVNDTAPPPPTKPITNATSGVWYDHTQSGQGFMIEILPSNTFLAVWFTFAPQTQAASQQNWLYIQGTYTTGDNSITIAPVAGNARSGVLLNTGAAFPPNFVSTDVTTNQWGTMTFTFTDCNHGTVNWNSTLAGYGTGTMNLERLSGLDGLTCQ